LVGLGEEQADQEWAHFFDACGQKENEISTVTFPLSALAAIVLFSFSKMIVVFLFSRRSIKDTAITAARPQ